MTDLADYSHFLQDDLTLGERLQGKGIYGDVYHVEQASPSSIPLVVRFISTKDIGDEYHETLIQRLELLSRGALPHVSHIVRYGRQDDVLWLVTDQYRSRLWDTLRPHQPTSAADPERLFLQTFDGLETLHDLGIPHGDLRSRNVFLSTRGDSTSAWIGDAAIGCFSWWTGSKIIDNDCLQYAIPGQESTACKPSFNQDLYALGLMGCELFLGHAFDRSDIGEAQKQLKGKCSPSLQILIKELLSRGVDKEPCRCGSLRKSWQAAKAREQWLQLGIWGLVAIVLVLFIGGFATAWWSADSEAVALDTQLRNQVELVANQNKEIERLKVENEELRRHMAETPSTPIPAPVELTEEQKRWQRDVVKKAKGKAASEILATCKALKLEPDFDSEWITTIRDGVMNEFYDTQSGQSLTNLLDQYAQAPWGKIKAKNVRDRIAALNSAKAKWKSWAENSYSWDEVNRRHNLTTAQLEKEILADWLLALSSNTSWKIRLIHGEAAADGGWDSDRIFRIYVDDSQQGPAYKHTWKSVTKHKYDPSKTANTWSFNWKPDQTIRMCLENDAYAWNTNMIYNPPFDGALALWKAYHQGEIRDGKSVLKFKIIDCPGPPPPHKIDLSSNPTKSP